MTEEIKKTSTVEEIHKDAQGQLAQSQEGRTNDGVNSAKPTVVTGGEDATFHKTQPGKKRVEEWSLNYDENEGKQDD